jgi:hypothetical protein
VTLKGLQILSCGPVYSPLHSHLWKNARDDDILERRKARIWVLLESIYLQFFYDILYGVFLPE